MLFNTGSLSPAVDIVRAIKIVVVALWEVPAVSISSGETDKCRGSNIFGRTVRSVTHSV